MAWLSRVLVWLCASAGLLLAGFAVLATALFLPSVIANGFLPPLLQRQMLGEVYTQIAMTALLPELGVTSLVWLSLAFAFPKLDRSWRTLLAGLPAVAALGFPPIGRYLFTIWEPTSPRDYVLTLLLVSFAASAALLVPRALSQALRPGCFTIPPNRGMVNPP